MIKFRIAVVCVLTGVLWAGSTAEAAAPTKNTTYKGDGVKLIVKDDNHKIAKAIIRFELFGTKYKNVLTNINIKDNGRFYKDDGHGGLGTSIRGKFTSKHKAKGHYQVGEHGADYKATD